MSMSISESAALQARLGRIEGYLQQDVDNLGLLHECVDLAFRLGKLQYARKRAERALSLAPGDARFLFRLASVCIAERRLDDAERILSELRSAGTEAPVVCYNLAYTYVLKGRDAEAAALLREILTAPDCPPEAETLLMRSLHGAGQVRRRWRSRKGAWKPSPGTQRRWASPASSTSTRAISSRPGNSRPGRSKRNPTTWRHWSRAGRSRWPWKNPTRRGSISSARSP